MKAELKNHEIDERIKQLEPLLEMKGTLGYIAAVNANRLNDAVKEYIAMRDEAVRRYGTEGKDASGEEVYRIDRGTKEWDEFMKELKPIMEYTHTVEIETIPAYKVSDQMTGRQMLDLAWMIDLDAKKPMPPLGGGQHDNT